MGAGQQQGLWREGRSSWALVRGAQQLAMASEEQEINQAELVIAVGELANADGLLAVIFE